MKKFILLIGVLFAITAQAKAPFLPEEDARFNRIEAKKMAKFVYDVSVSGYGSSTTNSGVHGTGVYLPAGAIITRSWVDVLTQFAGTAGGLTAFHCETAGNVRAAASLLGYGAGTYLDGESTGASTLFKPIAAECEIKATVTVKDSTAGKLVGFVEYVVGDAVDSNSPQQ